MDGIDKKDLDAVIAKTYNEVKSAVTTHSEKSVHMYSTALRALLELREVVVAEEHAAG
ncbi:hypothetical protein [Streptomyces sp. NPDC047928]|uniref:hypothetical protein n=1 Tax=unclassified Streptomyces TaxID=2593676 RepID=UPI0037134D37